jgi:glycosyltransferase involved in cell wall biosynthesis
MEQKKLNGLFRVAFIAVNLQNPYKDLAVFTKAINEYSRASSRKICVVLVGNGVIPIFEPTVEIENIQPSSESEMALLLSTIDLVVVPSNQDNSPSVIGEALSVGVPVIGSDAGGIPEVLRNFEMPVFPVGDVEKLTQLITSWKPQIERMTIREKAAKEFSEEVVGREMLNVYSNLKIRLS